jgi:hypothetical protein
VKFIKLTVKNHTILHGFDLNNKEILERCEVTEATTKLFAIDRIKSIAKDTILVEYAFNRMIFWEYEEDFAAIVAQLEKLGAVL